MMEPLDPKAARAFRDATTELFLVAGSLVGCAPIVTADAARDEALSIDDREAMRSDARVDDAAASDALDATGDTDSDAGDATASGASDVTDAAAQTGVAAVDRVVFVYTPHGTWYSAWTPTVSGTSWTESEILAPLTPFHSHIDVVSGIDLPAGPASSQGHFYAPGLLFTGRYGRSTQAGGNTVYLGGGTSLDVVLGQRSTTPARSVFLGVQPGSDGFDWGSWTEASTANPPETDPRATFARLLAPMRDDPRLASLRADLATSTDFGTAAAFPDTTRTQLDLIRGLFVPDQTRVAMLQLCRMTYCPVTFSWVPAAASASFTSLSHDTTTAGYVAIQRWFASQVAYLLGQLQSTPTRDGLTLLDHTLVVWISETGSDYYAHSRTNLPVLLAGGLSGRLRTGQFIQLTHRALADLWLTIGQAMDPGLTTFGDPAVPAHVITELQMP